MTQKGERRVLVVEDEPGTAETIALYLQHEGLRSDVARDGHEARSHLRAGGYALVILDLMLPGVDGLTLCREIRRAGGTPVIMVTALGQEPQKIRGLDLGADDYVVKPFSPRELMARVRARLRAADLGDTALRFTGIEIDPKRREVHLDGRPAVLTAVEFDLLLHLARRPGQVFTREQLMNAVLSEPESRTDRAIDAHIKNLRRKIEQDRRRPQFVQTVFGVGYRFGAWRV